ncbi:MAG: hypothetical protein EBZ77_12285 [Chitinophagia bacterium]|nr:hypothetical protein [Chitinophagia bacterium]
MGSSTTLTDTPAFGTWATSASGIASVSTSGVVLGRSPGEATISYSITNSCGTATDTFLMTIEGTADAGTITGADTICAGSTTVYSNAATGGTWSSSNASIATIATTGTITAMHRGPVTINYTVSNSCGTVLASRALYVDSLPNIGGITGSRSGCAGGTYALSVPTGGGTWSSSNIAIASVSTTGMLTTGTAGTVVLTYSLSNSCGTSTDTFLFQVLPTVTSGTLSGPDTVCVGATVTLTPSVSGGAWSVLDATIASVTSAGVVYGVRNGSTSVSYSVSGACSTGPVDHIINVLAPPSTPVISGAGSVCTGATIVESASISGGTWRLTAVHTSVAASTSATFTVRGGTIGSDTLYYSLSNTCGSAQAIPKVINVVNSATPGAIYGPSTFCQSDSVMLTDTGASAGGRWTSASPAIATVDAVTGTVYGVGGGSADIHFVVSSPGCGADSATYNVVVNPAPNAGSLTGTDTFCAGSSTLINSSGFGSYWGITDTTVANITTATPSAAMVQGYTAGTTTIYYVAVTVCGADTATRLLVVLPPPPGFVV